MSDQDYEAYLELVKEITEVIEFLEYEEALTKDKDTASRIRTFMIQKKYWRNDGGDETK